MSEIKIKPIGFVRNKVKEQRFGGWNKIVSEIVLNKEYKDALDGIEGYSHAVIMYWMSEVRACDIRHRPQGNPDVPVVGIFACRCPARPNPIAITTCRIVKKEKNTLTVKGLDAINNTPVIDIKPYTAQYDSVRNARIPRWVNKLKY